MGTILLPNLRWGSGTTWNQGASSTQEENNQKIEQFTKELKNSGYERH